MPRITIVSRTLDGRGWLIALACGVRLYCADRGGSWLVSADGSLGRQIDGTCDSRIPQATTAIKRFVRRMAAYEGEEIRVDRPRVARGRQ